MKFYHSDKGSHETLFIYAQNYIFFYVTKNKHFPISVAAGAIYYTKAQKVLRIASSIFRTLSAIGGASRARHW
jgi:hypothetical protein